jgi:hypothetical protein
MKFQPKTESEIKSENLLEPGVYDFEIMDAADKTSKAGNEMIELKICIYGADGNGVYIFDYLLESIAYKLRHACDACGLLDKYQTGTLAAADFINKTGKCKVATQKDKTGQYADRNGIADYIKHENLVHDDKPTHSIAADLNDDIPFS